LQFKGTMFTIQTQQQSLASENTSSTNNVTPNILPCRINHDGPVGPLNRYWKVESDEKGERSH
jgi:ribonuclease H2 subunit C